MNIIVQKTLEKYNMISHGERIMCGLSGGADSVAMFRVLLQLSSLMGFSVCAAHLNHMLRGDESVRDAEFVKRLCKEHNAELYYEEIDIAEISRETGESIELAARNQRYKFFERGLNACKADKIATAHNADDNLETVIMHLARGSALNGLGGIPPVRGNIIRPLIEIPRSDIEVYLTELGQRHVEDSTNAERVYTRNNVRLDVLPVLRKINPSVAAAVARGSEMFREDEKYISDEAFKVVRAAVERNRDYAIEIDVMAELPDALRRRVILQLARKAVNLTNYYLEFEHVCDIINLMFSASPSAALNMPGGLVARRRYNLLVFGHESSGDKLCEMHLSLGDTVVFGEYEISCGLEKVAVGDGAYDLPCGMIMVRTRRAGDEIKLIGRPRKTLKKLFIDEKLPKDVRDSIPVFTVDGRVAAVHGFGVDESFALIDKKDIMWVTVRRI